MGTKNLKILFQKIDNFKKYLFVCSEFLDRKKRNF